MSSTASRTGSNPVHLDPDTVKPDAMLRYRRMARTLRLSCQVFSPDLDTLEVVDSGRAPAWTSRDGSTISINASMMPGPWTRRNVAVWLGTKDHELAHNLFTPRAETPLMQWLVGAPTFRRAWNILEDQRIERLLLARFPGWRGYLVAALSHHIDAAHPEAWPLIAGRTWLGDEVRALSRAAYATTHGGPAAADWVAKLIGDYQRLFDPGEDDSDEAIAIITAFAIQASAAPSQGCDHRQVDGGWPEYDDPDSDEAWPTADADPDESDEGEPLVDTNDDESDDESGEGEGGDDESDEGETGSEGGDADADDPDGDGGSGDGGSGDDPDDDGEPGDGEPGESAGSHRSDRKEAVDRVLNEALSDEAVAEELDDLMDTLANGAGGELGEGDNAPGYHVDRSLVALRLSRDVSEVLYEIRDDCEAGWIKRTDRGRFNIGRRLTDPSWDVDTAFDVFDPGAIDATAMDVVMLLDVSDSMAGSTVQLGEAAWAIHEAVDRIEGECMTLTFATGVAVMSRRGERPDGRMFVPNTRGGTAPAAALREALYSVAHSDAANRIVLILTDGMMWGRLDVCDETIAAIRAEGAVVAVAGMGRGAAGFVKPGFAGADVTALINEPGELVGFFRQVAEASMLKNIAAAR